MAGKKKPEPRRVRLTIPAADESSQVWIDLQDDASVSMRMLIRESVQRDGYVDVVNRPVEQQPRRGRPPKGTEEAPSQLPQVAADDDEIDEPRHEAEDAKARAARTRPVEEPEQEPIEQTPAEQPKTKRSQAPSGLDAFLTGS